MFLLFYCCFYYFFIFFMFFIFYVLSIIYVYICHIYIYIYTSYYIRRRASPDVDVSRLFRLSIWMLYRGRATAPSGQQSDFATPHNTLVSSWSKMLVSPSRSPCAHRLAPATTDCPSVVPSPLILVISLLVDTTTCFWRHGPPGQCCGLGAAQMLNYRIPFIHMFTKTDLPACGRQAAAVRKTTEDTPVLTKHARRGRAKYGRCVTN